MSRKGKTGCDAIGSRNLESPSLVLQGVNCIHISVQLFQRGEGMLGCSPNPYFLQGIFVNLSDRRLGTKSTFNSALSLEDNRLGKVEAYQVSLLLFKPNFQVQSWRIFRYELYSSSVLEKRPPALFKASVHDRREHLKYLVQKNAQASQEHVSCHRLVPRPMATRPYRM